MPQRLIGGVCTVAAMLLSGSMVWAQEDMGNIPGVPDRLKFAVGG